MLEADEGEVHFEDRDVTNNPCTDELGLNELGPRT